MNRTAALESRAVRLAIVADRVYLQFGDGHSARHLAAAARRLDRAAWRARRDAAQLAARRAARIAA